MCCVKISILFKSFGLPRSMYIKKLRQIMSELATSKAFLTKIRMAEAIKRRSLI